ncbi:uncharacterized protein LOC121731453 isoform X2 [Aricia agestis]|uniref:uncharacterized protein LOC121731453 isoform X2 n=1 Tax=Aricia agestis TaxID=91739 RepID=UPI001C20B689|nr:uncharacterized protein LOC121731453 isoform X2 [Aricia agestis]
MNVHVIFLSVIIQLPNKVYSMADTCPSNSRFIMNGLLCVCNREGAWSRVSCSLIGRREPCAPAEVHRHGCSRCTCHRGNLICDHTLCPVESATLTASSNLSYFGPSCSPFRSYYFNCSLCVCPASGKTSEAQCIVDLSCPMMGSLNRSRSSVQNVCLANVIYLFPCLQCLCSERGTFVYEKCVEKCYKSIGRTPRRCMPGSMYRVNCSVCRCPENGIHDDIFCVKVECNGKTTRSIVRTLPAKASCTPHAFTEPICYYCDCSPDGVVDDRSCIEIECPKIIPTRRKYTSTCSPGEVTPLCVECFCLRNGNIRNEFCTRNCSDRKKIAILETILKENFNLIDDKRIVKIKENEKCEPNFLYLDDNSRYCLCLKGNSSSKACTLYYRHTVEPAPHQYTNVEIDYNASCKPITLVEFGCNVCYCSKTGKIDPKWCTIDDCEAIKKTQESHWSYPVKVPSAESKSTCEPGAISRMQCNFCICPENGLSKDRVCTKNYCEQHQSVSDDAFVCDPLAYYRVDCNVCLCPKDGLKNVAKCTKNVCESNFLRSDLSCTPGHLFVEDCNICVCPISGKKEDTACTNHACEKRSWKVLKAANVHMSPMNLKRNLDVCFRGEEFIQGCNLCLCPEDGFKNYAICEDMACDQESPYQNFTTALVTEN